MPYLKRWTRSLHAGLIAAATLIAFMCLTRMHERYLYPYFVFAGLLGVTGRAGILYWVLSALFFANQLLVYLYQQDASAGPVWLWRSRSRLAGVAGAARVACFSTGASPTAARIRRVPPRSTRTTCAGAIRSRRRGHRRGDARAGAPGGRYPRARQRHRPALELAGDRASSSCSPRSRSGVRV